MNDSVISIILNLDTRPGFLEAQSIATTMMNIQRNKIGVKLAEIELGQSCFPYEYFDAERFAIVDPSKVTSKEQELSLEEV